MGATALLIPGVQVRAATPAQIAVRLVELASRHGWPNTYLDEPALLAAGCEGTVSAPETLQRLERAGQAAFSWLKSHAVPVGFELINADSLIVLDRA